MTSTVERLGLDDGSDPKVVTLHPRTASRPMPRAWTEAIDRHLADIALVISHAQTRMAETLAAIPPPTVPVDPAPLIEAAVAPVARHATAAVDFARQAMEKADGALATAQVVPRQSAPEQVLIVFRALARILAVRLLLFLSLAGSFSLAVMAMGQQSWLALVLVVAFAALTIGPLAWLEVMGRAVRPAESA